MGWLINDRNSCSGGLGAGSLRPGGRHVWVLAWTLLGGNSQFLVVSTRGADQSRRKRGVQDSRKDIKPVHDDFPL